MESVRERKVLKMASKIRRLRQRAQRRERRQTKAALIAQSQNFTNDKSVPKNINLTASFKEYAIRETRRDIREQAIDTNRIPVLERALKLANDIDTKKRKRGEMK